MASPAFGSAGTQLTATTAANAVVAVPASVAADDVVLVHLYKEGTAAVTPPAGFTEITPARTATSITHHVFWKRATGADSGTYTFSWTGSLWREAIATRYTACVTSGSPVDVSNSAGRSTSGTVTPAVSVTTTGIERLLVWSGTQVNSATWTAPSGYTLRTSGTRWQAIASVAQASAGSSGSVTGTSSASGEQTAWLVALLPIVIGVVADDTGTGSDTADVVELVTVTDTGTGADAVITDSATAGDTAAGSDVFATFDATFTSGGDTGSGIDAVSVIDVAPSSLLPLRGGPSYEVVVVARIPAITGPPTLLEVDPILWTTLDWTTELSKPQSLSLTCEVSTIPESILQRLRRPHALATELWLKRDGQIVFAGPLAGGRREGETLTLVADGLLAYLGRMVVYADLVFAGVDQVGIVKALVDHWQARPFGNFGIDTSAVGTSGVLRDATYLRSELHRILQRVQELGLRQNGFDVDVDPQSRALQVWSPLRGVDRSTGEDAVVFDARNIINASLMFSVAADDVATVAFGTGTSSDAGGSLYGAPAVNAELLAQYGASAVTGTWDSVSEQPTLDAHIQALLAARGETLFVPGPNVRVTPDADISSYDPGDTVRYEVDDQIGVAGGFRLRSVRVAVSSEGIEQVTPGFA